MLYLTLKNKTKSNGAQNVEFILNTYFYLFENNNPLQIFKEEKKHFIQTLSEEDKSDQWSMH